ncbi:MAG: S8/S53 family peptidase, partial [Myxococcota bacterium]
MRIAHRVSLPLVALFAVPLGCTEHSMQDGVSAQSDSLRRDATRASHESRSKTIEPLETGRACRNDLVFIERVLWDAAAPKSFGDDLETALDNELSADWFCAPADLECLNKATQLQTYVEPLLVQRSGYGRDDGHRRFYRLFFAPTMRAPAVPAAEDRWALRDGAQCEVLSLVRSHSETVSGLTDGWRIGRECEAIGGGLSSWVSDEAKHWHEDRIGVEPSGVAGPSGGVRVALIDAGVRPEAGSALSSVAAYDGVGEAHGLANDGQRHIHGTAMASFIRDVSPDSDLWDYRVLDSGGLAALGSIVRAVDQAISDGTTASSLVINLSLGIAPEFSNPSLLARTDGSCRVVEDGVGESLRYVLDVARRHDEAADPRITVVAAAGNRSGPVDPALFFPADAYGESECGKISAESDHHSFLPALYSELPSCRSKADGLRSLVTGVGAVDSIDKPAVIAIDGAEPALVAPGENVYAAHDGLWSTTPGVNCASEVGPKAGAEFPLPFTGTSVSSALVAGAAAVAQQHLIAAGESPLSASHLTRLLYLTGESTCRRSAGIPVRRLSVGRLLSALDSCEELVSCAQPASESFADIDSKTLTSCADVLAECGLETLDSDHNVVESCAERKPVKAYSREFFAQLMCEPGTEDCVPAELGCVSVCGPEEIADGLCDPSLALETPVDRHILGTTGPQPETSGCLDCGVMMMASYASLMLTLNPYLPEDTEFEAPSLSLTTESGESI